jgi:hypothetical protein
VRVGERAGRLVAAAPAMFGFGGRGLVDDLLCAAVLVGLALATPSGDMSRRGGGWSRLVRSD